MPGATNGILCTLRGFGFEWDGDILRQSDRSAHYAAALERLNNRQLTFECSCSRQQLEDDRRYPGTCRSRPTVTGLPTATRLRVESGQIVFSDRIQGNYAQDVAATVGDVLLRRRDHFIAYVLAVVVDDAAQGVTHIVRGADLLDNTPRQIYLQRLLGSPSLNYAHVPLLSEPDGNKLAKSRRSVRLDAGARVPQLLAVFSLLGLSPPSELKDASIAESWTWAVAQWHVKRVPKLLTLRVTA